MTEDLGIDGIPMELPILQYEIVDILNCQTPSVCPKCLWRGLIETRDELLPDDFFCPECLKNNKEINLVTDVHWEARAVLAPAEGAGKRVIESRDSICPRCETELSWYRGVLSCGRCLYEPDGVKQEPTSANDVCCKDFLPGLDAIHKSCERAALNGVGMNYPATKDGWVS